MKPPLIKNLGQILITLIQKYSLPLQPPTLPVFAPYPPFLLHPDPDQLTQLLPWVLNRLTYALLPRHVYNLPDDHDIVLPAHQKLY